MCTSARSAGVPDAETRSVGTKRLTEATDDVTDAGNLQPFHKMNITEMQREAALVANEYQIDWEKLSDLSYRQDFVDVMEKSQAIVPTLESMYMKMSEGKSVALPDAETPLKFSELEKYRELIGEELYSGYILREIYHKFQMVEDVMIAAHPLDNPPRPE